MLKYGYCIIVHSISLRFLNLKFGALLQDLTNIVYKSKMQLKAFDTNIL